MRDAELTKRARAMRREMTGPEARLWLALRAKRFEKTKFRRQKVIGPYIADFSSREPMLVIEVDGDTHADDGSYDAARTAFFQEQGYRVLRFNNADVTANLDGVLATIATALPLSQPSPLKERGL